MVETALMLHGHVVETYRNVPSFLSAFQKAERTPPYDLVIIDLFLDQQSGTDIVEALRVARPRMIPSILLSAAAESTLAPLRKRYLRCKNSFLSSTRLPLLFEGEVAQTGTATACFWVFVGQSRSSVVDPRFIVGSTLAVARLR